MHDLAGWPDIDAVPINGVYGWRDWQVVRKMLRPTTVQTDSKPRTVAGVPPAIKTIDAFVGELAGVDPGGVTPAQLLTDNAIASVLPGEVALAIDIVSLAIEAADGPVDSENRRDARSWLQDNSRIYSARLCFEVLGFKYDAVRKLLIQRWMKEQG